MWCFFGVLMDITARKKVEEENLKRQQFLESVLYHVPDAIIPLDPDGRVVDWNPGAVKIFGYSREEAMGVLLEDLASLSETDGVAGLFSRLIRSEMRVEAFEIVRHSKDGDPLHLIASGSPIVVDQRLTGFVVVLTDITERKQWERALETSETAVQGIVQPGAGHVCDH